MREAGQAELVLGALHPPCELDALVCVRLGDLGRAGVGGGDEQREVGAPLWVHEAAVHLGADARGVRGVDGRDLVDWDRCQLVCVGEGERLCSLILPLLSGWLRALLIASTHRGAAILC